VKSMYALIAYDIVDNKRRTKLHAFLKEFGLNTQKSVFECELDHAGLVRIRRYVINNLDPGQDNFRIHGICRRCYQKVAVSGQGFGLTTLDYMVV